MTVDIGGSGLMMRLREMVMHGKRERGTLERSWINNQINGMGPTNGFDFDHIKRHSVNLAMWNQHVTHRTSMTGFTL